jgi:hypothetical protein
MVHPTFKSKYLYTTNMPTHLISPPAVQRVVPVSRIVSPMSHVSVSGVHTSPHPVLGLPKPPAAKPAAASPVSTPVHLVSKVDN